MGHMTARRGQESGGKSTYSDKEVLGRACNNSIVSYSFASTIPGGTTTRQKKRPIRVPPSGTRNLVRRPSTAQRDS